MFEGFAARRVRTADTEIHLVQGGEGPPLLLLHGYPQTHACWHKVAPLLARRFTVVAADLRGYGDSGKPPSSADHASYSKRVMARDQVEAMAALGLERFFVAGHDRGARVGHRMALDHPQRVLKLAVLDIVPTRTLYATVSRGFATDYYHWFFLIQPPELPERLIAGDPEYYLRRQLGRWGADDRIHSEAAIAEYLRSFRKPETIHATCEDYRAAASIDLEHDEADLHCKVQCPLLALWGSRGVMARYLDVLATWRERAEDVQGGALDCAHYLPEELPEETAQALAAFFGA